MKDHDAFIDELLGRLENQWKERGDANLRKLVPEVGHPQRRLALVTLIPVDQEYRWRSSNQKQVEIYLDEWPELHEDDEAIVELVEAECVTRADLGDLPSADEIHTRFPKLIGLIDLGRLAVPQKPTHDQVVSPQAPAGKNDPAETDLFSTTHIEKAGENIGPYHLLTVLGEGGFGTVYLAEQQRPVKRRVALKVIKPGMDSRQVIARFEAERQALAMMDHPNIAKVFDAGVTDTGRPYFVMELVQGEAITDYCDRHKLTIDERLELFVPVCEAIQHAHQKGIIHRDIKPTNVLVTIRDDQAMPKIIDFGVAKAMAQPLTERTLYTEQGQLIGTPAYMSPEQAEMTGLDIDTRSDVYSLGVLLYELLTGALPFDNASLRAAGLMGIAKVIREEEPPKPSTKISTLGDESEEFAKRRRVSRDVLRRRLRGDLDWIIMKTLEKDRRRRYSTALDLADDLMRYQRHEAVEAAPPALTYRVRKRLWKYRLWYSVSAVIAIVLLGGIVASTHFALEARENAEETLVALGEVQAEKRRADEERDHAREQEKYAKSQEELAQVQATAAKAAQEHAERQNYFTTIRLANVELENGHSAATVKMLQECPKELRGWEWGYLMARCPREEWKFKAHEGGITAIDVSEDGIKGGITTIDVSEDGRSVLTAGHDGRLILWNACWNVGDGRHGASDDNVTVRQAPSIEWAAVTSLQPRWHLPFGAVVQQVAFVPGNTNVIALCEGQLFVCDSANGEVVEGPAGADFTCFCVSPNGQFLYAGRESTETAPPRISVHPIDDLAGTPMNVQEMADIPRSIGVDFNGTRLVRTGDKIGLRAFSLPDFKLEFEVDTAGGSPRNCFIDSRTGRYVCSFWRSVLIGDSAKGSQILQYVHQQPVTALSLSDDGGLIASAGNEGAIRIRRTKDDKEVLIIEQTIGAKALAFDRNVGLFTGDSQGVIRYWKLGSHDSKTYKRSLSTGMTAAARIAFSPNGRILAVRGWADEQLALWNTTSWKCETHAIHNVDPNASITQFRPGTDQIILADSDAILLKSTRTPGLPVSKRIETKKTIMSADVDASGHLMIVCYQTPGGMDLCNLASSELLPIDCARGEKCIVAIDRNGSTIAALAAKVPSLKVFSAETRENLMALDFDSGGSNDKAIAFSPDGSVLATTGGPNGTICIWDTAKWEIIGRLIGHEQLVCSLDFSPDGKRLLSGAVDHSVRLWDWKLGKELLTIASGQNYPSLDVSFSPDGLSLAHTTAHPDAVLHQALPWNRDEHVRMLPGIDELLVETEDANLETLNNSLGMEFVLIPTGQFSMGSSTHTIDTILHGIAEANADATWFPRAARRYAGEVPRHRVTMSKPYWFAKHEVTVAQFRTFVADTGYETEAEACDSQYTWSKPDMSQTEEHPVRRVSWNDATAFCQWLSKKEECTYRLPTEAEWEYACIANSLTTSRIDPQSLTDIAWFKDNAEGTTHPVGEKRPNRWGLFDMLGNVNEWCQDWFASRYFEQSPEVDPTGPVEGDWRAIRGGAYFNGEGSCCSTVRFGAPPQHGLRGAGFRILREYEDEGTVVESEGDQQVVSESEVYFEQDCLQNTMGMRLCLVPSGKLLMGSSNAEIMHFDASARQEGASEGALEMLHSEGPRHEASITSPFYLGQCEVTVEQWSHFVDATGYVTGCERRSAEEDSRASGEASRTQTWKTPGFDRGDDHPVVCIDWEDAVAFCSWLSETEGRRYRLPTEAEWEYACRAGSPFLYGWGEDIDRLEDYGWFEENSNATTQPTGQKKPNSFGLHDMYGNAAEWCHDWSGEEYYAESPEEDPEGPDSGERRVVRGGHFDMPAIGCRASARLAHAPTGGPTIGFRVVCEDDSIKSSE